MAYSFKRVYTLQPQTPLINFQYTCSDSSLRATEVKPKLDEFLSVQEEFQENQEKWRIKEQNKALNYKMHFTVIRDLGNVILDGKGEYSIYYGNMGSNQVEGTRRVTQMEITCFDPELLAFIDKHICTFFIVTNFGRMQGKGFGSFTINKTPAQLLTPQAISSQLKAYYGAKHCYSFKGGDDTFTKIKMVYSLMKSGSNLWLKNKSTGEFFPTKSYHRSILFEFMHDEYETGNEKAWLKQKKLAPAISGRKQGPAEQVDEKSRYVRALLGIGEHIDFLNDLQNRRKDNKTVVTIESDEIARLSSPIFFKVINGNVYYVGKTIDGRIYGKSFTFKSPMGEGTLTVPTQEELGEDFMDKFLEYCKEKLNGEALGRFRQTQDLIIEEV